MTTLVTIGAAAREGQREFCPFLPGGGTPTPTSHLVFLWAQ